MNNFPVLSWSSVAFQEMMMPMSTMMLRSEEKPDVVSERRRVQLLISAGPQM